MAASTCSGSPTRSSTASSPTRAAATDENESADLYAQAAETAAGSYYATGIADRNDVIAARSDITGFTHVPVYIWVVKLADLERE